ncbi:metal dependent phosphohydrolase [Clostridium putrefaciens]|uniref:Metal dependent phosphohydrolase n=1 Tax=Clostridium putrefaciens TaxID=99675 RepID=A0A381J6A9_9CLOT|nr:HD domain-containing protein [Clostridium putrefaciens]SUY46529.1 metal dependent phosphohydrolase [Clostridium putrefaciens]
MLNGKIIRDSVHGDIFIEQKFLDLIETPEFQRLRRIHQLSVANLVFPSAEHTRFSHSIGTFHVMKLIIDHFEEVFNEVNIVIGDRDKNLCLAIALLHDIGHGPFSHAFEGISKDSHEEWTKKIIL